MATNTWTSPWLAGPRIDEAITLLERAGYERGVSAGAFTCDEEPMYRDGGYLKSLVVYEDPTRPVIERLKVLLSAA